MYLIFYKWFDVVRQGNGTLSLCCNMLGSTTKKFCLSALYIVFPQAQHFDVLLLIFLFAQCVWNDWRVDQLVDHLVNQSAVPNMYTFYSDWQLWCGAIWRIGLCPGSGRETYCSPFCPFTEGQWNRKQTYGCMHYPFLLNKCTTTLLINHVVELIVLDPSVV